MTSCPPWCVERRADHERHRGQTHSVPVVLEARGAGGPHRTELLVELSRMRDEAAAWLYLGDGWSGLSLTPESAQRVAETLRSVLRDAGTLEDTGL